MNRFKPNNRHVYLDHAAATPVDPLVKEAMLPYNSEHFGNPSALYRSGRIVKEALTKARERIAEILHASPDEIYFTGSGTESDAIALLGVIRKTGGHLIVGSTEHHAVLYNAEKLEREGFDVTYCAVNKEGFIDLRELERAIRPETTLISIMYVNNEIGTIAPMAGIRSLIKRERERRRRHNEEMSIYFHTDACQAAGYLDLDVHTLGVDLMTINASKLYGPKGIGILYVRKGVPIESLWRGGGQERKLRSGTENIAGIVGLATALEFAREKGEAEQRRIMKLRDYFIREIFRRIPKVVLNGPAAPQGEAYGGHPEKRICNNVNVSILDIEGEALLLYLDAHGIEASTGSACDSVTLDPSHVILALGKPYEFAHASMRFSLGRSTTKEDIDHVLTVLPKVVKLLRVISPINLDLNATTMSTAAAFAGAGLPHWERKRGTKLTRQKTAQK